MKSRILLGFLCFLAVLPLPACSIQRLAVEQTGGIIARGLPAFFSEGDLELAHTALASNIKLLETLLETAPTDETLLLATSQALTAYAFGFVETEMEDLRFRDPAASEAARKRGQDLYDRARQYARRALTERDAGLAATLDGSLDAFDAELASTKAKHVPAMFWLAYAWGGYINLSKDSIAAVANIVKVEHLMKRVAELDETYFVGGPHLFLGVYYGSRPRMFGGDPVLAEKHLKRVEEISGKRLLMVDVMRAQHLAVLEQDEAAFGNSISRVLSAPDNLYPEQRLLNALAKSRAEVLLKNQKQLF